MAVRNQEIKQKLKDIQKKKEPEKKELFCSVKGHRSELVRKKKEEFFFEKAEEPDKIKWLYHKKATQTLSPVCAVRRTKQPLNNQNKIRN